MHRLELGRRYHPVLREAFDRRGTLYGQSRRARERTTFVPGLSFLELASAYSLALRVEQTPHETLESQYWTLRFFSRRFRVFVTLYR